MKCDKCRRVARVVHVLPWLSTDPEIAVVCAEHAGELSGYDFDLDSYATFFRDHLLESKHDGREVVAAIDRRLGGRDGTS